MTTVTPTPDDLINTESHTTGAAHEVWRWMRDNAPIHHHEAGAVPAFWSLTRYEDIKAVYRTPETFSSVHGVLLRPACSPTDPGGGLTLALTDPPRHRQLRALTADWFTQRSARRLSDGMHTAVRAVLTRAAEAGECDFVHDIAGRLSIYVIGTLLGVPEHDHESLFRWTNEAYAEHKPLAAQHELMGYISELMYDRMQEPADDLISALVNGTIDGELLTEQEILLNAENLIGATENGRLAMAGGMLAFLQEPDQWNRLRANRKLLPSAVEEVLRWTSSATHSMRTVVAPTELRGRRLEPGERVVLWVPSANRDAEVFADPDRFDVARTPNRHLALGIGEHFCLGATMARTQMKTLFTGLLDDFSGIEQSGPTTPVHSIAVGGPATLPVRITA